ncbi:hypothetical protein ACQRC6_09705, partial [Peptoniphilus sp. SGI.035]
ILLVCDGATWHKSNGLKIPENIEITHIPPYTPEMKALCQMLGRLGNSSLSFSVNNNTYRQINKTN